MQLLLAHAQRLSPLTLLNWLGLSEFIGLASKVLSSIVHCYMVIDTSLIVDYTISVLNYIIMFLSLEIWAWLQLGHTQNIGVVVPRAPF